MSAAVITSYGSPEPPLCKSFDWKTIRSWRGVLQSILRGYSWALRNISNVLYRIMYFVFVVQQGTQT